MARIRKHIERLGQRKKTVIVILVLTFEVLGILSAMHAVMNLRAPQGLIAWAVSLVIMPVVAVPAYWVFGRNRFQLNFRNHRKTVVVGGREAWVGGHNVGDEYLGRDPKVGR